MPKLPRLPTPPVPGPLQEPPPRPGELNGNGAGPLEAGKQAGITVVDVSLIHI